MTVSAERRERLPRLHLIADSEQLRRDDLISRVRAFAAAAGSRLAIHLRGHELDAATLFRRARECRDAVGGTGAWIIVNDRVDIALAIGADGVQLGERAMAVGDARRLVGESAVIGASVHDEISARRAISGGADFLLAGTIFPSASHPGREPAGTGLIGRLAQLERPVIAIGGIVPDRVDQVRREGGWGVAVISAVWNSPDPVAATSELIEKLER